MSDSSSGFPGFPDGNDPVQPDDHQPHKGHWLCNIFLFDTLTGGPETKDVPFAKDGKRLSWAERRSLRRKNREETRETRRSYRIEKIKALTAKFYAVAAKRKWLVFLIGICIIAYMVITSGGISFSGIIQKIKGFF